MVSVHYNYSLHNLQRNLQINGKANASAMQKLASGFRINTGADGPADLIISEQLRSQIDGLERAIQNTNESNNLMAIAEGAMSQVADILLKMKDLAVDSANTGVISPDQIAANQANMDSALQALDRIYDATNVAGRKILDDLQLKGRLPMEEVELNAANIASASDPIDRNKLFSSLINGENMMGEKVDNTLLDADGNLTEDRTLLLTGMGENGDEEVQLSLKKGDSVDDILERLAPYREELAGYADAGEEVSGTVDPLEIQHSEDGKTSFLSADMLKRMEEMAPDDAKALLGNYLGTFNNLKLGSIKKIDLEKMSEADREALKLSETLQGLGLGTAGGVKKLVGHDADGRALYDTLSLDDLWSGGDASLANDPVKAMEIIDKARKEAVQQRATIGATMSMAQHSVSAMEAKLENLTRMESYLRDTDMAESMVEYSRTQILMQTGTRLMSQAMDQNKLILDLFA